MRDIFSLHGRQFLLKVFLLGVGFNLIWEFNHCRLYVTCLEWSLSYRAYFLSMMSLKDGFFITLFYSIAVILVRARDIAHPQGSSMIVCVLLAITFAFIDEKISTGIGRWVYADAMPLIYGVGISPLLELGVTGGIALSVLRVSAQR